MSSISKVFKLLFLVIFFAAPVHATTQEQARAKGLAWLMAHQKGDGSWESAPGLEVQTTAAALDALMNAGIYKGYSRTTKCCYGLRDK